MDKIYVSKSKILRAGRGVFAARVIRKGEIIESCPIIILSSEETENLKTSILGTYLFYFGKNKSRSAMVLGNGSIYNHSLKPNARFEIKEKIQIIEFMAVAEISKNEEITFNYYNSETKQKNPLWFE